jgi:hypothetical protein
VARARRGFVLPFVLPLIPGNRAPGSFEKLEAVALRPALAAGAPVPGGAPPRGGSDRLRLHDTGRPTSGRGASGRATTSTAGSRPRCARATRRSCWPTATGPAPRRAARRGGHGTAEQPPAGEDRLPWPPSRVDRAGLRPHLPPPGREQQPAVLGVRRRLGPRLGPVHGDRLPVRGRPPARPGPERRSEPAPGGGGPVGGEVTRTRHVGAGSATTGYLGIGQHPMPGSGLRSLRAEGVLKLVAVLAPSPRQLYG